MPAKQYPVPVALRWVMGVALAAAIVGLPLLHYRQTYTRIKRLRVVEAGRLYRCGLMTSTGLQDTLKHFGIKTVINLMDEEPDPELPRGYFGGPRTAESELCEQCGAKMLYLYVDLTSRREVGKKRPAAIDRFLEIMDDPDSYPVLLHCRAGLHRTGVLTAIYRMEYQGWDTARAWQEMRKCGFGRNCFIDNDYIQQYLFTYEPGRRRGTQAVRHEQNQ